MASIGSFDSLSLERYHIDKQHSFRFRSLRFNLINAVDNICVQKHCIVKCINDSREAVKVTATYCNTQENYTSHAYTFVKRFSSIARIRICTSSDAYTFLAPNMCDGNWIGLCLCQKWLRWSRINYTLQRGETFVLIFIFQFHFF